MDIRMRKKIWIKGKLFNKVFEIRKKCKLKTKEKKRLKDKCRSKCNFLSKNDGVEIISE